MNLKKKASKITKTTLGYNNNVKQFNLYGEYKARKKK